MTDLSLPENEEIWKPVVGYENFYLVSSRGSIFSKRQKKILKLWISNRYYSIRLSDGVSKKSYKVHRVVLAAFHGPSNLPGNHKDMNKLNNHIDNLEYVTHRENTCHAKPNRDLPRGIYQQSKNSYCARIYIDGKTVKLGSFKTSQEAHLAYVKASEAFGPNRYL